MAFRPAQHGDFPERWEPLVARLNSGSSGVKFDKRALQALVSGLHQFQEDALGVNVSLLACRSVAAWRVTALNRSRSDALRFGGEAEDRFVSSPITEQPSKWGRLPSSATYCSISTRPVCGQRTLHSKQPPKL